MKNGLKEKTTVFCLLSRTMKFINANASKILMNYIRVPIILLLAKIHFILISKLKVILLKN